MHGTARRPLFRYCPGIIMTDTPTPPPPASPTPPGAAPGQPAAMPLTMHGQYIKDLSFENPAGAARSLIEQKQPQLTLNVSVQTRQFDPQDLRGRPGDRRQRQDPGERAAVPARADLCRHGLVGPGAAGGARAAAADRDAPRLLFPFACAIIANTTASKRASRRSTMSPVDFVGALPPDARAVGRPDRGPHRRQPAVGDRLSSRYAQSAFERK